MEYFTPADIEGSGIAHDLKNLLGCTCNQQLINVLNNNLIINYPYFPGDAWCANFMYGIATAILKGATGEIETQVYYI